MNKNGGKLLVAFVAMAMVIAGAAVVLSDEAEAKTITATEFSSAIDNDGTYNLENDIEVTLSGPLEGLKKITGTAGKTLTINYVATAWKFSNNLVMTASC